MNLRFGTTTCRCLAVGLVIIPAVVFMIFLAISFIIVNINPFKFDKLVVNELEQLQWIAIYELSIPILKHLKGTYFILQSLNTQFLQQHYVERDSTYWSQLENVKIYEIFLFYSNHNLMMMCDKTMVLFIMVFIIFIKIMCSIFLCFSLMALKWSSLFINIC